ncbi:MAG: hypothetical protein M1834_005110 [Cirrosporium novae-zelandiae]|nr:MAG: hypothetical protein M1834_005110 [Cirrosporium novae-zelandiae]
MIQPLSVRRPVCIFFVGDARTKNAGSACDERHIFECPDYANKGSCPKQKCRLPHVDRAGMMRKNATNSPGSPKGDNEEDISSDDEYDEIDSDDIDSDDMENVMEVDEPETREFSQQQDFIEIIELNVVIAKVRDAIFPLLAAVALENDEVAVVALVFVIILVLTLVCLVVVAVTTLVFDDENLDPLLFPGVVFELLEPVAGLENGVAVAGTASLVLLSTTAVAACDPIEPLLLAAATIVDLLPPIALLLPAIVDELISSASSIS